MIELFDDQPIYMKGEQKNLRTAMNRKKVSKHELEELFIEL